MFVPMNVPVIEEKRVKRKDCYNCGTVCGYSMIDGTGATTKEAVLHRRKIHNGERCDRWSEP